MISVNHALVYYRSSDRKRQLMRVSLPKTEAGIRTVPDDERVALIEKGETQSFTSEKDKKRQAFQELDAARAQIKMYLPDDFDPDKELEDCLQDRCAEEAKADFIVTRNTADFAESKIPAIEPEEFLHKIC